ncbi:MAG: hypothetical protein Q8Q31_02780 [Nanoarchaeota archaeon]|nr:hypothetical protein [Nanoarchaeota archaeon]
MRDEIWAGLKNALERGQPLEQAVQSFINAGYNANEVKEAARSIGEGASNMVSSQPGASKAESKAPEKQTQKAGNASSNLQSITLFKDEIKDIPVKDIQTDSKIIYVPEQKLAQGPQIEKIKKDYIPYDGVKSTRKKRLAILISFLLFLILVLILAVFFYNDLLKLIKDFYTG